MRPNGRAAKRRGTASLLEGFKVEEIKTTFNGKYGNGGLTLYVNPFGTGKKFYGRFERDVLSMENLISRVQEKNPGTDENHHPNRDKLPQARDSGGLKRRQGREPA